MPKIKLTQKEIIKLAVDIAFGGILEDQDGSSYHEQAISTVTAAERLIKDIEAGKDTYREPDFIYCGEEVDPSEDLPEDEESIESD
jgi:hypothetical protein